MAQCGAGIHADPEQARMGSKSTKAMLAWFPTRSDIQCFVAGLRCLYAMLGDHSCLFALNKLLHARNT